VGTGAGEEPGEKEDGEDWQLKRYAADMKMDRGPKSPSKGSFPIKPSTFCSLFSMWMGLTGLQG
jgi:hypothetical protein